ncbi:hypothetical protein V5F77_04385 [Xanthobacter sp. DSM 24535]|uniref:hypothetical protein n=1 Tax=Roseixanthobacter psychrophilus TaxID=3119917 RepID=UPI003729FC2A
MATNDHGVFTPYVPLDAAPGITFLRNGKGLDWYALSVLPSPPAAWVHIADDGTLVVITDKADRLFPINARVVSADGVTPDSLRGKRWNGVSFVAASLPVPASITRRQCALEMHGRALITDAEALAMASAGTPPAFVETQIAAMPAGDRLVARIDFAATSYERANPLLVSLMEANGSSPAQIDDFFRSAAAR